jgi:hypothetical protein
MLSRFSSGLKLCAAVALVAVACASCKSSNGPQIDANSNWLRLCDIDSDCVAAGGCICGLCSDSCASDAECSRGKLSGPCVTSRNGTAGHRCAQDKQLRAEPLCLPQCSKAGGCDAGFYCESGACWPEVVRSEARTLGASSDLSTYDAAVSFDAVPVLPDPELVIRTTEAGGNVPLGVWLGTGSLRLEVRHSDALGGEIATLQAGCEQGPCLEAQDVLNRSKMEELSDDDVYSSREWLVTSLSYRAYDGVISSTSFAFWISNNELWRDWCAPQAPRAFMVGDKTVYACNRGDVPAPRIAPDANGHEALCARSSGVCSCDASNCRWNPYTAVTSFDLVIAGDGIMRGSMKSVFSEPSPLEFVRLSGESP